MIRAKKGEVIFYLVMMFAAVILVGFDVSPFLITLLIIYLIIMIRLAVNINENIYIFLFLVCFFIFLIGRPVAVEIFGLTRAYVADMNISSERVMYIALIESLIFLVIGYVCTKRGKNKNIKEDLNIDEDRFRYILMKFSRAVYIILGLLQIIEYLLMASFVMQFSYKESYISYVSSFPSILHSLVETTPVVFALYLATLPDKRNVRLPWIIYMMVAAVCGFIGLRYELISSVIMIVLYCFLRNVTDEEPWIGKKEIVFGCFLVPFVLTLLQFMSAWRQGIAVSSDVKHNPIVSFFYAIGGSSNLIAYQDMYHDMLKTNRETFFSFGYIVNALRSNIIAQFFGIKSLTFSDRTAQALQGYSFDRAISYYVYKKSYLNGYGAGSCYIAELMCDFSYLGVAIGNLFYGFILKKLSRLSSNKIFRNFILIFLATLLFRVCRDSFSYPIVEFVGLRNILIFVFIWYGSKTILHRKNKMMKK